MKIKRFTAAAVLAFSATVLTAGVVGAEPVAVEPAPPVTEPVYDPAIDDPVMHQCNAIIGALVGGVIGGSLSAVPGAAIGAAIGAAVGWSLLYPPGPPLACWRPSEN
ncbi:hypothetical protein LTV02_24550 [Nocardia yamanashiensis]|uniref:hypothetical protein n=1 Tax=Nocardia yamanashiensis TaxID=209247 RepID=UPI001E3607BB|nr:hypothetical protein [Nocardia yamanashiensis]UGT39243.1 hypothetical protein LTV02_24550 [Nocardia yamanashiensis]